MAEATRPQKIWRLNYASADPRVSVFMGIFGDPAEARMAVSGDAFVSVTQDAVNISGGNPSVINVQGMPNSIRFGGLFSHQSFPMCLIPSTVTTPVANQTLNPPMKELIPLLNQITNILSSIGG